MANKVNEAENHIQDHKFGLPENRSDPHTNVLLLSLSTFQSPIGKTEFSYSFDEGKKTEFKGKVTGRYQLDPIPKMLDALLAKREENLDKIIMLCTEETKTPVSIVPPEGETVKGIDNENKISPNEYFKNQVRNYMNPYIPEDVKFVEIGVSVKDPYSGIEELLDTIREIKKVNEPHLYLDTHGGIRGIQRILEATVILLYTEGIDIKEAYSIELNPKRKIIEETDRIKIFNFTSGINELISCGRVDVLEKYMESMNKQESMSKQDNDLKTALKTVSEGIQWCNIPWFQEGLKRLKKVYDSEKEKKKDESYLNLYKDTIEKYYEKLIGEHNPADEIEWCIDKGFYQQALTLIESKISELLINHWEILTVDQTNYPAKGDGYGITTEKDDERWVELNEFFNAVVHRMKKGLVLNNDAINDMTDDNWKGFITKYESKKGRDKCNKIINDALANATVLKRVVKGKTKGMSSEVNVGNSLKINECKLKESQKPTLFCILVVHATLKDVRNTANHAASNRQYKPEKVKLALTYYMKWIKSLNPQNSENIKKQDVSVDK